MSWWISVMNIEFQCLLDPHSGAETSLHILKTHKDIIGKWLVHMHVFSFISFLCSSSGQREAKGLGHLLLWLGHNHSLIKLCSSTLSNINCFAPYWREQDRSQRNIIIYIVFCRKKKKVFHHQNIHTKCLNFVISRENRIWVFITISLISSNFFFFCLKYPLPMITK